MIACSNHWVCSTLILSLQEAIVYFMLIGGQVCPYSQPFKLQIVFGYFAPIESKALIDGLTLTTIG